MAEKKGNRVTPLRKKREAEGWARVDLNIPPGPALDRLNALCDGDARRRVKVIIEMLERAV